MRHFCIKYKLTNCIGPIELYELSLLVDGEHQNISAIWRAAPFVYQIHPVGDIGISQEVYLVPNPNYKRINFKPVKIS